MAGPSATRRSPGARAEFRRQRAHRRRQHARHRPAPTGVNGGEARPCADRRPAPGCSRRRTRPAPGRARRCRVRPPRPRDGLGSSPARTRAIAGPWTWRATTDRPPPTARRAGAGSRRRCPARRPTCPQVQRVERRRAHAARARGEPVNRTARRSSPSARAAAPSGSVAIAERSSARTRVLYSASQRRQRRPHVGRQLRRERHLLAGRRVNEAEQPRVQRLPSERVGDGAHREIARRPAVDLVAQQRAAERRQVHAHLVRPPRLEPRLHPRRARELLGEAPVGDGALARCAPGWRTSCARADRARRACRSARSAPGGAPATSAS